MSYIANARELATLYALQVFALFPKTSDFSSMNISVLYKSTCPEVLWAFYDAYSLLKSALAKAA